MKFAKYLAAAMLFVGASFAASTSISTQPMPTGLTRAMLAALPAATAALPSYQHEYVSEIGYQGNADWVASDTSYCPSASYIGPNYICPSDATPPSTGRWVLVSVSLRGVGNFGSLSSPTSAASALTNAIAAAGYGNSIISDQAANLGTAPVTNPGVNIIGGQPLYYTPASPLGGTGYTSGGRLQNQLGHDPSRLTWGLENVLQLWGYGIAGYGSSDLYVTIIGDSKAVAYTGPKIAAKLAQLGGGALVHVTNCAVSGTSFDEFVNALGPFASGQPNYSCRMAAVLTSNGGGPPHLIINMYGGTNEPYQVNAYHTYSTDPVANFFGAMDAFLVAARAGGNPAYPGIVLIPTSVNREGATNTGTTWKRDEYYNSTVNAGIRARAIANHTVFIDIHNFMPDVYADFGCSIDVLFCNRNIDASEVHPLNAYDDILAQYIVDALVPPGIRTATIAPQAFANDISSYPYDRSFTRATGGGWTYDGFAATDVPKNLAGYTYTSALQTNWGLDNTQPCQIAFRHSNPGGGWSSSYDLCNPTPQRMNMSGNVTVANNSTGYKLSVLASTVTGDASGTTTREPMNAFGATTYTTGSALAVSDLVNLQSSAPVAGTNVTALYRYALQGLGNINATQKFVAGGTAFLNVATDKEIAFFNNLALSFNRDIDTGFLTDTNAGAFQWSHSVSSTAANDCINHATWVPVTGATGLNPAESECSDGSFKFFGPMRLSNAALDLTALAATTSGSKAVCLNGTRITVSATNVCTP